ncbi:MAG: prepilin-type N-terminal cleavage/methylation domain-containing protein [Pedosphaera sp.]|nr:prepilin-type N-terminal cleavage/methylation domain-containing protein [Pedosphaera sp.]
MNFSVSTVACLKSHTLRRSRGFTLLELLVAVSLLSIVVLALYAVFNQTQKAFRASLNQTNVGEGGRAAFDLLVRDLERSVRLQELPDPLTNNGVNLVLRSLVGRGLEPLIPSLAGPGRLVNAFDEVFFVTRHPVQPNRYEPQGYFISAESKPGVFPTNGVGTLYRLFQPQSLPSASNPNQQVPNSWLNFMSISNRTSKQFTRSQVIKNQYFALPFGSDRAIQFRTNSSRLIDGVVLFRVSACDATGRIYDRYDDWFRTNEVLVAPRFYEKQWALLQDQGVDLGYRRAQSQADRTANATLYSTGLNGFPILLFEGPSLPAFLEVELAVLEPSTLETFRSLPSDQAGLSLRRDFLRRNAGKVQIFRQRIPLRSAPRLP